MLSLFIYSISLICFLSYGTYEFLVRSDEVYDHFFAKSLWLSSLCFDRLYQFTINNLQLAAYEGFIFLAKRNIVQGEKIPRFIKEAETLRNKKLGY